MKNNNSTTTLNNTLDIKPKVLVVDDEESIRYVLTQVRQKSGPKAIKSFKNQGVKGVSA